MLRSLEGAAAPIRPMLERMNDLSFDMLPVSCFPGRLLLYSCYVIENQSAVFAIQAQLLAGREQAPLGLL